MSITVVGGFGLGISFFVERFPKAGETLSGAKLIETPGGKGSNQAIGVARLGGNTRFITAIAADSVGALGKKLWAEEGIDAQSVITLPGASMRGAVVTDQNAENRIIIADGVLADLDRAQIAQSESAFANAKIVLVSSEITAEACAQALEIGRKQGAYTILNPAPVPEISLINWGDVDLLTPNQSEALLLLGENNEADTPEIIVKKLSTRFDCAVVMTAGAKGVFVKELGQDLVHVPGLPVAQLVDTTGAGDSFNAGLAYGLDQGLSLVDSARLGNICGAITVQNAGVVEALPYAKNIRNHYQRSPIPQEERAIARLFS